MSKISDRDVLDTIESALKIKSGSIDMKSKAEDVKGWDSLGHLSILIALDTLFEGKIGNLAEIAEANSIPKILTILNENSLIE